MSSQVAETQWLVSQPGSGSRGGSSLCPAPGQVVGGWVPQRKGGVGSEQLLHLLP